MKEWLTSIGKALNKEDWIIGFIEGEGCFTIQEINGYKYPRFYISQNSEFILELIKRNLIRNRDIHLNICKNGDDGNYLLYSSTNLEENKKIVDFLDGKILRKKESFNKFKDLIERKMNNS